MCIISNSESADEVNINFENSNNSTITLISEEQSELFNLLCEWGLQDLFFCLKGFKMFLFRLSVVYLRENNFRSSSRF